MKSYLKIVASMCIWSTWGLLIRWIALPPVVVLFYTSLAASLFVPLVLRIRGDFPDRIFSTDYLHLFVGLALASLLNNITYFYALGHTSVANAVFTHYTAPIVVAVLAPLLISERLQRVTIISLPIACAGMALIVVSAGGLRLNGDHLAGIVAGAASGLGYAFMILLTRRLCQLLLHYKANILLLWMTVISTAPAVLGLEYHMTARAAFFLLITGVFHSTVAPLMYFNALKKVLAQHAAILGYVEPLAAIPLAFLFLSETPSLITITGGLFILVSGYLVVRSCFVTPSKA